MANLIPDNSSLLPRNNLESLLKKRWETEPSAFWRDGNVNYSERFEKIADHLNKQIHTHTLEGALAAQIKNIEEAVKEGHIGDDLLGIIVKNSSWLTDHGPEHIQTVIQRASDLVSTSNCELSSYEIYVLLTAIHFHDVGNIFGRDRHEKKITEVMAEMDESIIGDDDFEKRLIRSIAAAHGGSVNGDEDTIRHLPYARQLKAQKVRPHLLAAILRFADELAEDHTRASRFSLNTGNMLQASEIYHQYADRLREVNIEDGSVEIHFELSKDIATKQFGKGNQKVFLLDEIFSRTLKIHCEHAYCMRYMRQEINLNSITIRVGVFENKYLDELYCFDYKLEERGYPNKPNGIHEICDGLTTKNGARLTGETLNQMLTANQT
jgi:hypothetical protein